MSLPPNFCIFETLDEFRMKTVSEEAAVKIRYNRRKEAEEVDMEDWEVDIAREEELKGRLAVDWDTKTYGNLRTTDTRKNKRIHLA